MRTLNLLLVEESASDADDVLRRLSSSNFDLRPKLISTAAEFDSAIEECVWDFIISDLHLPEFNALQAFWYLRQGGCDTPFLIVSGIDSDEAAIAAIEAGVNGYLLKQNMTRLVPLVERILRDAAKQEDQHRTENALRESEDDFRGLAKASSQFIWTAAEDGTSPELFKWFSELSGANIASVPDILGIMHPNDLDRAAEAWTIALKTKSLFEFTCRFLTKESEYRYFVARSFPLFNADGTFRRWIGTFTDADEQIKRENEIRQQAMLIEQSYEAIFAWDIDTGIILWNKGCERLYGYTQDEVLGRFGFDVMESTFSFSIEDLSRKLAETGFWSGEVTQVAKDGRIVNVESRYQLVELGGRRVILQTNRDISDQKKAEELLIESEARYRNLFDNNPYSMWVYDVETLRFLAVNNAATMQYGFTEAEFLAMDITQIRPSRDIPSVVRKAAGTNRRIHSSGEWTHRKRDGTEFNVEITSHGVDFEGKLGRLVLAHDISERVRAEELLKQSEEKYRDLFENANDLIYTHDLDGNFLSLNHAGEIIIGYTAGDAIGRNIAEVVSPEFMDTVKRVIGSKINGGPATNYELDVIAKDGKTISLEVNSRLIINDGKPVGVQGIGRDVTARRSAEEALRKSEEQLMQAQKLESIGILAGGISHDFNNMLTAINGYSELILRRIPADDPIRGNVEEIKKAGERSAALTRQLLAFSRRQILLPKVLNINEIITETTAMLGRLIGADISISTALDQELGSVEADPGQLAQVLMNLAVNARDAMDDGGTIVFETANVYLDEPYAVRHIGVRPGEYVMLAVSDTGTGMDEATSKRIFEPFFTTKETGRGTGLGLSTVYGIVKQSGGNIWVYSEPGKGTTFKVYLPRVSTVADLEVSASMHVNRHGTETILLAEDEAVVRKLTCEILESYGYTVIEAHNGIEALEISKDLKIEIDLLMTDIVMPKMGGRELASQILEIRPGLRVLFASGYTDDAIMRHGIIDEGTNFIQKPFSSEALTLKIRNLLDT